MEKNLGKKTSSEIKQGSSQEETQTSPKEGILDISSDEMEIDTFSRKEEEKSETSSKGKEREISSEEEEEKKVILTKEDKFYDLLEKKIYSDYMKDSLDRAATHSNNQLIDQLIIHRALQSEETSNLSREDASSILERARSYNISINELRAEQEYLNSDPRAEPRSLRLNIEMTSIQVNASKEIDSKIIEKNGNLSSNLSNSANRLEDLYENNVNNHEALIDRVVENINIVDQLEDLESSDQSDNESDNEKGEPSNQGNKGKDEPSDQDDNEKDKSSDQSNNEKNDSKDNGSQGGNDGAGNSLIDDFADVSQELPSYTDPED